MSFKFEIFLKRLINLIVLAVMFISLGNSAYASRLIAICGIKFNNFYA